MNIFPRFNPSKNYTEEECRKAASSSMFLAIVGFVLTGALVGVLAEAFVFPCVKIAQKSSDSSTVRKAEWAKRIAIFYWVLISMGVLMVIIG